MKLSVASIAYVAAIAQSSAFTMSMTGPSTTTLSTTTTFSKTQMKSSSLPLPDMLEDISPVLINETVVTKPVLEKKTIKAKSGGVHQEGLFSPIVMTAKKVIGDENLNKIRGKVIGLHSEVIGSFVDTHETFVGSTIMQQLFALMDKNKDGVVDETELAIYFKSLGFTWLQEKQIAGIIKRAGSEDGILRIEQFKGEFPKTLRTNLIKLAKKNGGELGFLS
jgi:hypothetical protein